MFHNARELSTCEMLTIFLLKILIGCMELRSLNRHIRLKHVFLAM